MEQSPENTQNPEKCTLNLKVKRKSREDTTWKNVRFFFYGQFRMFAAIQAMSE